MSSESDYKHAESSRESSSGYDPRPPAPSLSRRQSRTPLLPSKRRRPDSTEPTRIRKYHLEGRYNDAYRELFNEQVSHAATRFQPNEDIQHYTTQIGASVWTSKEQALLFAALERLGRDDIPGIAKAVGTKSVPEIRTLLLLLQDAAAKHGDAGVTLRDIPAAVDVSDECNEQLDITAEALAWYQETFEESQERERYGDHWLITPAIADEIETAVNGRSRTTSRAASATPASEPDLTRRGVAGACTTCKQRKVKCDRGTPCNNCVRSGNRDCVYPPKKPPKTAKQKARQKDSVTPKTEEREKKDASIQDEDMAAAGILDIIPEANLLQPDVMLTLSKNLFMNRSPSIPSPWPHWSEYVSDVVTEPSIYRTAFKDFHTLVISITRRLMQCTIIEATSRLRSQRRRSQKGNAPYIKRRDVLTAIDILGMKRDGKERWKGVARRCGVRVFAGQYAPGHQGKSKREVPWNEFEHIMGLDHSADERLNTETPGPASGEQDGAFKSRAMRSGTPLPMERLALSSDDDSADVDESDIQSINSDESMDEDDDDDDNDDNDDDDKTLSQHSVLRRDSQGRYTSAPPMTPTEDQGRSLITIEAFDRQASRQEEDALWQTLGLEPTVKDDTAKSDEEGKEDLDLDSSEKIITDPDDWRNWTEYKPEWEAFRAPVPASQFIANQKPLPPMPKAQTRYGFTSESESGNDTGASGRRRHKRTRSERIELQTKGPRAYAAQQERVFVDDMRAGGFGYDGADDADVGINRTMQSIEANEEEYQAASSEDEMDWDE